MIGQEAIRRARRRLVDAGRLLFRISNRWTLFVRDVQDAKESRQMAAQSKVPSLAERQEQLIRFYDQYENLVETLCDAAQYGPDARQEGKYDEMRRWMLSHYPPLRCFVAAYLSYDPRDAARNLDLHGTGRDAFEALFAAPTLDDFLRSDDGQMISRIQRTREALSRYGEHLRQLIAQERR